MQNANQVVHCLAGIQIIWIIWIDFFMDFIPLSIFDYFQCTMQIDSSTASLELLTCDLTNKDEAISINKVIIVVITTAPFK